MSNFARNTIYNGAFGFLVGYGTRKGFDAHNRKSMAEKYRKTGQIPTKKSMGMAIVLAFAFGSFGLFYISPRTAMPLLMIDFPLMMIFVFSILLRPLVIFIAIVAVISHNNIALELFGRYKKDY